MRPDNSIAFFQYVKAVTEAAWETADPQDLWGPGVATGSKWKPGLTEQELQSFEAAMGFTFPQPLRNFYSVMNGLDRLCTYHNEDGIAHTYAPFYSYPESLEEIQEGIFRVYNGCRVTPEILKAKGISRIFPVWWHRFIMIDEPGHPVLSMYGNDIVFWGATMAQACQPDILRRWYPSGKKQMVTFWYPYRKRFRRKTYRKMRNTSFAMMPKRIRNRGILTPLLGKKKRQIILRCRAMG